MWHQGILQLLELTSVTLVRDRTLRMHARVALWSTRPRASIDDRRLVCVVVCIQSKSCRVD